MFKNFFKTTIRSLLRNKGYSFLNIFGLAIGIACAGLIFLWVQDEMNWDSSFDCSNNDQFPGDKSSNSQSCELFEK